MTVIHPQARNPSSTAARRRQSGISLILVAIMAMVLIGLVGLALDAALVASTAQQLQHAADAASLAGARLVKYEAALNDPNNPYTLTRQAAIDVALANVAANVTVKIDQNVSNDPNGDIVVGMWDTLSKTLTPDLLTPNAVRVRCHRTPDNPDGKLALMFGPVFGWADSDVGADSTAALAASGGALMVILDETMPESLLLNGNVLMSVNGDIHVNSSANCAARLNGAPEKLVVFTYKVCVEGSACYQDTAISGTVVEQDPACQVPDPLADVLPTTADWDALRTNLAAITPLDGSGNPLTSITDSGTYSPGYYPAGLTLTSTKQVTLTPGTYMFGPPGIELTGSAFVTAGNTNPNVCGDSFAGVTILIDQGASVKATGSGAGMALTAPKTGPLENIALMHHRSNSGNDECKLTGGGSLAVRGYLYCPAGEVVIGGGPGKAFGAVIADRLKNSGTTSFKITGCGIPIPEDAEEATYLVE